MPGRSKKRWARRKRLRRRRTAKQRHAFALKSRRTIKYYADEHSQQCQWIAIQQRAHTAAKLLQIRLTRVATPRVESCAWLEGLALAYARYVPFSYHKSIVTADAFIYESYFHAARYPNHSVTPSAIVCGATDALCSALYINRVPTHAGFHYTHIWGLPKVFLDTLVRTTFREGPATLGILRANKQLSTDSNDIAFVSAPEFGATLEYHDTDNKLHRCSLRSVVRIDVIAGVSAVMCRDGYVISILVGFRGGANPLCPVFGPFNEVEVTHDLIYPDVHYLTGSMLCVLIRSHGGIRFGHLPAML